MYVNNLSLYNNILGSLIVIIGFFFAFLIIKSYLKSDSIQTLALGIVVFGASTGWLVELVDLVLYLITGSFLSVNMFAYLEFAFMTLVFPGIVFVTVSIIKSEQLKIWFPISLLIMIIMYIEVFILVPLNILNPKAIVDVYYPFVNGFPENSYVGLGLLYITLTIISGLLFGILMMKFGYNSEVPLVKVRGYFMGAGLIVFSFFSIVDGLFPASANTSMIVIMIITRVCIIIGLYLLYLGVSTPNFIRKIFNVPE